MLALRSANTQSGNQRQRPNPSSNTTDDPLVSPVSAADLAYFMGAGAPDAPEGELLDGFLLAACEQFIAFANRDLLTRTFTLRFDRNPERQPGYGGLGPTPALLDWWVELPLAPVTEIVEVRLGGEVSTDFSEDLKTNPARVGLHTLQSGDIEIDYNAGWLEISDIPASILLGIKSLAAHLYDHRGGCDAAQAMNKSGAAGMWSPFKLILGGL